MAYFIQTQRGGAEGYLIEMPAKQLNQRLRDYPSTFYARVSAKVAHDWVRAGARHGTLLYTEAGKIRRASDK